MGLGLSNNARSSSEQSNQWFKWNVKSWQLPWFFSSKKAQPFVVCSAWIQLSGHPGSFIADGKGKLLKHYNEQEAVSLRSLSNDVKLQTFVPKFYGDVQVDGIHYVHMQDLLFGFDTPSVMDCKIGRRTYLETEVTEIEPERRPDMYAKMVAVDTDALTQAEHQQQAVTKLRYMLWRESRSSSASFGFRIEAIKKRNEPTQRDFKSLSRWDDLKACFEDFVASDKYAKVKYRQRLYSLRSALENSSYFAAHEVVGSSILFVHDDRGLANLWMIDFGKTRTLPAGLCVDHRASWHLGNHEDGYLFGIDHLIKLFEEICSIT